MPPVPFTKMAAAATGGGGAGAFARPQPVAGGSGAGREAAMLRAVGLLWLLLPGLAALEPLSVGLAIGVASALTGYLSHPRFYCNYVECCPSAGQRLNATGTAGAWGGGTRHRAALGSPALPRSSAGNWSLTGAAPGVPGSGRAVLSPVPVGGRAELARCVTGAQSPLVAVPSSPSARPVSSSRWWPWGAELSLCPQH